MERPENALIPLLAAAALAHSLNAAPLRLDALFGPPEAWAAPAAVAALPADLPVKPAPAPKLVRDRDDHFGGAS